MTPDLDDAERAALVELLAETIATHRFLLSPRVRMLRAILVKLGNGPDPAQPYLHRSPRCGLA